MPVSLSLSTGTLLGFLLVLARVSGALAFVPLPGIKGAPGPARVALAGCVAFSLWPRWPHVDGAALSAGRLAGYAAAEAGMGIAMGLVVAAILESVTLAAQILGLQAGYAYAAAVDPNTEADSGVLLILAQLVSGMLFFALGLDREILRLFARSLDTVPAGTWALGRASAAAMIGCTAHIFSLGLRLAMPVVALLLMIDLALALLGRLNQQLQLLSLAFPVKMLTALLALAWMAALFPRILAAFGGTAFAAWRRMLGL